MDPSTTNEGNVYSDLCRHFPITPSRGNKYIYIMYVYDCNAILTISTNNRSKKEMIRHFTELTTDLKSRGIKPGYHFMDNTVSTGLKTSMKTMDIKYQLVPPRNHRAKKCIEIHPDVKKNISYRDYAA